MLRVRGSVSRKQYAPVKAFLELDMLSSSRRSFHPVEYSPRTWLGLAALLNDLDSVRKLGPDLLGLPDEWLTNLGTQDDARNLLRRIPGLYEATEAARLNLEKTGFWCLEEWRRRHYGFSSILWHQGHAHRDDDKPRVEFFVDMHVMGGSPEKFLKQVVRRRRYEWLNAAFRKAGNADRGYVAYADDATLEVSSLSDMNRFENIWSNLEMPLDDSEAP